jgi:hypothetical protein
VSNANKRKVTVAARVEPGLAAAVARLAEAGDRSISREVRRALLEHVDSVGRGDVALAAYAESSSQTSSLGTPGGHSW